MTTIGLIRHGSTIWNKEGRAQGSTNVPLDEEGMSQARLLAERLSQENWSVLYSSELLRARQTAELLAEHLGLTVRLDSRLKEMGGGLIEGTTEAERIDRWGHDWRSLDLGIEKADSVADRGTEVIQHILKTHEGHNILVVSHGALIQCTMSRLFPDSPCNHYNNTSISILSNGSGEWTCRLHNCTRHLETTR